RPEEEIAQRRLLQIGHRMLQVGRDPDGSLRWNDKGPAPGLDGQRTGHDVEQLRPAVPVRWERHALFDIAEITDDCCRMVLGRAEAEVGMHQIVGMNHWRLTDTSQRQGDNTNPVPYVPSVHGDFSRLKEGIMTIAQACRPDRKSRSSAEHWV